MTLDEVIAALAKDQETTQTKIEDILLALNGLLIDAISRGERFSLPGGWLYAVPRREGSQTRAMIHFKASPETRVALRSAGLEFPPAKDASDLCLDCQIREVQKSRKCSTCLYRDWMKRRGHTVKPRRKNGAKKALESRPKIV